MGILKMLCLEIMLLFGIFQGVLSSQIACLEMIPLDTFTAQTSEIPYEIVISDEMMSYETTTNITIQAKNETLANVTNQFGNETIANITHQSNNETAEIEPIVEFVLTGFDQYGVVFGYFTENER